MHAAVPASTAENTHGNIKVTRGLPDGDDLVTFGLKGFEAFWGPKAETLKKIHRFEARLMSARSKATAV